VAESLGAAVLTLSVDDSRFQAGLKSAQTAAESFRNVVASLGVATTIGGGLAFIGNQVKQLDEASAAVRTLGVDSDELGKRLRALSAELDSNISQIDLTKAAYDVASSGFASASEATDILRASALGAKGGFADVNDVASALTGVLNAYGLSASSATDIVDKFVQTQADGVITVRQYAAQIGTISSIAAAAGVSIDELNAAVATATLRGVPVAQTFTGLRQAISSIIKPSEQAKELAASLGLDYSVAALQSKGFAAVLADVQQKTGGSADKLAVLLGSVEAQAAIQPLLNDRLAKYNELLDKQSQAAGQAASASEINAKTISGGLQQIGNGFSNLATTLDTTLTPLFGGFIKSINDILSKLNQVAALAPEKVLAREKQATDLVAANLGPLGIKGTGFFGSVSVSGASVGPEFKDKAFTGSATGVREDIIKALLAKDLAEINKALPEAGKQAGKELAKGGQKAASGVMDASKTWLETVKTANQIASIQDELAIQSQRGALTDKGIGALQAIKALEDAKRAERDAQAALRAGQAEDAKKREGLLNASRIAAENVQLAAAKTKADLIDAFKSAQDSVQAISRGIEDTVTQLQQLQNTSGGGLNEFMSGQQVADRQAALADELRPIVQEIANRRNLNFTLSGTNEDRNNAILRLIQADRQQTRLEQDLAQSRVDLGKAQNDLATINQSLVTVNTDLATATQALADKDWNVYVSVPGGSASGDVVREGVYQ
jgi:TP901 family phage tail tape measure protein